MHIVDWWPILYQKPFYDLKSTNSPLTFKDNMPLSFDKNRLHLTQ